MGNRRNILLFHGVTEEKNEDLVDAIEGTVTNKKLSKTDLAPDEVIRVQRMGRSKSGKPKPLILELRSQRVRDDVLFGKAGLKGSDITTSEFLTKRQRELFKAARSKMGIRKCWTQQGRIIALGSEGKRVSIDTYDDLHQLQLARQQATEDNSGSSSEDEPPTSNPQTPTAAQAVASGSGPKHTKPKTRATNKQSSKAKK